MAGLVPAIHVFLLECSQDVDARDEPGHDALPESGSFYFGAAVLASCIGAIGITCIEPSAPRMISNTGPGV
jgi:hypothetical protein